MESNGIQPGCSLRWSSAAPDEGVAGPPPHSKILFQPSPGESGSGTVLFADDNSYMASPGDGLAAINKASRKVLLPQPLGPVRIVSASRPSMDPSEFRSRSRWK